MRKDMEEPLILRISIAETSRVDESTVMSPLMVNIIIHFPTRKAFCPSFRLCLSIMHSSSEVTFIMPLSNMPKGRHWPFVFRSVFNNDHW